ncbi:hypothetical protein E2C01_055391 [Portunus trituberculatus]|uniref:Uncharacterized protein n=1 Tax=Portunus trituberculatus TaxID=210409 RepID=A0A5B7GMK4_PORTR|nr:hypothetical protein [Portunus trituberculatus]
MLSLEWDNDCLHQYEDEVPLQDSSEHVFQPSTQDRHQLLPDHSSLELDLEEELMSTTGGVEDMVASPFCNAPMTISIDSAIHSGTGSRSASSSPVPSGMGHSLLRYAPWLPSLQVHVLDSPCELHPHRQSCLKSIPRASKSRPFGAGVCGSRQVCQLVGPARPSEHLSVHRTQVGDEEKSVTDDSPSFDSALELSDRLGKSFSGLWSPL